MKKILLTFLIIMGSISFSFGKGTTFTNEIFEYLKNTKRGSNGEIQLTDAMQLLSQTHSIYSWDFKGKRYDIGTMKDWFRSHFELSLESDYSPILEEVLKKL